jgi:UDP-N-acetylbacillosamine N-acetyltransferase
VIPKGLLILGLGGHARSVADVALDLGISDLRFVDPNARLGEQCLGFLTMADPPRSLPDGWMVMPAAGDNLQRKEQVEQIVTRGWPPATLVSRRAYVGAGASVLPGAFVAHHAHIGPLATIGHGVLINTGAVVEHECVISDFAHISVNSTVAGRSRIGELTFVGAGAVVIDKVSVAGLVIIGAGSTVVGDIDQSGIYVGSPARRVR